MKLGNTSQSVVPVPNFFYNRTLREVDTFNVSRGRRYFKEKDLFRRTKDMNFSNNPRKQSKKFDQFNKEKYIPIHKRLVPSLNLNNSSVNSKSCHNKSETTTKNKLTEIETNQDSDRSHSKENINLPKQQEYKDYLNYMERTNVHKITRGDVREGIKGNIKDLLEKINTNYDYDKLKQVDTKAYWMTYNSIKYTPLTDAVQHEDNETVKFKRTLRDKVMSMTTIHHDSKEKAIRNLTRDNQDEDFNFSKTNNKGGRINLNARNNLPMLDHMRQTVQTANTFSNYGSDYGTSLQSDGDSYSINYKNFLVPFKKNLVRKKEKEMLQKHKKEDEYMNIVKPENYSFTKHRHMFCETHRIADDASNVFKSLREMKQTTFK